MKVFALLVVLAMVFAQGQSEEPAPYLYYFSDFLNAIVIERADGSDSRKLGEGLMPPDTDIVVGDWSPSGEWFAWRSGRWNEGGNVSYSGWIMSADGRRRLTVLDAIENVEIMEWSSVEDLLLVRSGYIPDGPEFTYYLIDVPNEEIITSFTLDSSVLWEHPSPVRWTPDGEHIGFYYYSPIQVGDQLEMRYFFRTVSRSGEIRDEQVNFIEGQHSVWAAPPTFSPDGKILYATPDRNALVVNDLTSGDVIIFDQPPEGISAVEWSASGDYALLFTQRNCGGQIPCADLWLLSASNDELSLIAENSSNAFPFIKLWSPQEDMAYFSTLEGDVYLLDAESGETAHLGRFKTDPASNDFISASWSTDGRQLLILSDSYRTLSLVDMVQAEIVYSETGEFRYNVGWESHTENFVFSPDNRYIALSNQNAVLDTLTNQVTRFITHSAAAYTTGQQAIYNWHSGSEWLVTGDLVFFAGGGGGPWANIVTRVDGTGRRELTKAVHIADWLPDNVIPHLSPGQPTSVLPAPALTLVHDSYVNGVAWHETQLAVHTVDGQVTIWDINDSGARQVRTFAVTAGCGEYPIPCRMSWSPDGRMLAIREEQEGFGIWDVEGGALMARLEGRTLTWTDNGGYATSDEMMSRSPDRQWIARVSLQNNPPQDVKIISAESNDTLWFVPLQGPFDLQWTPDSRYLLMVSGLAESKILDVRRGLVSELGDFTSYYGFDISPDGRLLVGASIYRTIQLWELPNGALSRRLNWYAMAAAFSDDGRYLAAGNTRLATIWESGD